MDHAGWVRDDLHIEPSPLGCRVAYMLGVAFGGVYNAPINPRKVDWSAPSRISITVRDSNLATYDGAGLTLLVMLAHALSVRLEICAAAPRYFHFHFTARQPEGRLYQRHPDVEQMVAGFRRWFDDRAQALARGEPLPPLTEDAA